ncbi:iron transporter, partial [Streptomyces sp. SID10244]|nr:iron transporter [Streptomyces sp. SID10244]
TVLAGIFNVRPDPTVLQVVAWCLYVVIVLYFFLRANRQRPPAPSDDGSATQAPAATDAGT